MSFIRSRRAAALPYMPNRPRLRFIEGAPDGAPGSAPNESQDPEKVQPAVLPDDHPLVKTLAAQKDQIKELKAKATRLDEIEESQKSELEKAIARAEAAEAVVAKRDEADAARKLAEEVAEAKGVSASVLRGTTREDLEAHADSILALIPVKPKAATDGSGGDRGDDIEHEEADAKEIASKIRI